MLPISFDGCAGWLHLPAEGRARGRGVIICESFGYEALSTQRATLVLARMCAEAGLPTLSFHYPGTGDSAGEETPGQIERWIASIGAAAAFLKAQTGLEDIALCGLRLGALLAIEAAQTFGGISALALLAPVLSGKTYARELLLSGSMVPSREGSLPPGWREFLGYRLHNDDLARLRILDGEARLGSLSHVRVRIASPAARPAALPADIAWGPFQHHDGLAQHAQDLMLPLRAFRETATWLAEGAPRAAVPPVPPAREALEVAPGLQELVLRLGPGGRALGILTRPAHVKADWGAVILNSGLNHHTGNGRSGVRLARRLAARGVPTLRLDLDKIGDCAPADPDETVGFHDLGRVEDVRAAVDQLVQQGSSRVLLTGICAGAYIGLHAAANDPRIRAAVLVNLPYFYIRDEDPAIPLWRRPLRLAVRLADRTRRWRAALLWNRNPEFGPAFFRRRYVTQRVLLLWHYALLSVSCRLKGTLRRFLPALQPGARARRLLQALVAHGTALTLVYGTQDWGLVELGILFPDHQRDLVDAGYADLRFIENADHTLTNAWMFDAYARILEEMLGLPPEAPETGSRQASEEHPA
ncbi:hypothetical protein [Azorhizobium caulinodans]|uniref:hypothetical protein n=1 Tax=Azorhizobium caulinodans TaxID=7 RepID=UPI002FBD5CA0